MSIAAKIPESSWRAAEPPLLARDHAALPDVTERMVRPWGWQPGSRVGRYEIVELLARGGMAEVFAAMDRGPRGFERRVALKRLHPRAQGDERASEMFACEARLGARLTHSNIVQILDVGELDGEPFLALEYVDGVNLEQLLRAARGHLPADAAAHIALEILAALEFAHGLADPAGASLSVVHRDVSPSNVLLSRAGEVKLGDFGVARTTLRHTAGRWFVGKPRYMSPEQARGEPIDGRSDLFSTGVVLWELLTGVRPFEAPTTRETLDRVACADIGAGIWEHVPHAASVQRVLARVLARDRRSRHATAGELAVELHEYLRLVGSGDPRRTLRHLVDGAVDRDGEPALPITAAPTRTSSRRSGLLAAAATAIALTALGVAWGVASVHAERTAERQASAVDASAVLRARATATATPLGLLGKDHREKPVRGR